MLTMKESILFSVLMQVEKGSLSHSEACERLRINRVTLWRKIKAFRRSPKTISHGLKGRISNRSHPVDLQRAVTSLYERLYLPHDFGIRHFYQKARSDFPTPVGYSTVVRWLRAAGLRKKAHKGRKHRARRERRASFGDLIQMDTSIHDWLSIAEKHALVSCIDDATSLICGAYIAKADTTLANMTVLKQVIRQYGLFNTLYVDKSPIFKVTRTGGYGRINQPRFLTRYTTQVQRAMEELGIQQVFAHSPQAKGRIERSYKTFQSRLIPELRFHKIKTIDEANAYLQKHFIKEHNRLYAKDPKQCASAFVALNDRHDLDAILCEKHDLTIGNDHIIESKTHGVKLKILPSSHRYSYAKAKVSVYKTTEGKLIVKYKNESLNFKNLS